MPQQMIGPGTGLTERVGVRAAEEKRLHVHVLDVELACHDLVSYPLMRRVEPAGVAHHGHQTRVGLFGQHRLGGGEAVGQRDLDLHVLARVHAGDGLRCVHLGWCGENRRIDIGDGQRVGEIGGPMVDAVLGGHLSGGRGSAAHNRNHVGPVEVGDRIEMVAAECAGAGQSEFHACVSLIRP